MMVFANSSKMTTDTAGRQAKDYHYDLMFSLESHSGALRVD